MGSQDGRLESIGGGACGVVEREREKEKRLSFFFFFFLRPPRALSSSSAARCQNLSPSISSPQLSQRTVRELELRLARADQLLGPREEEEADAHGKRRTGKLKSEKEWFLFLLLLLFTAPPASTTPRRRQRPSFRSGHPFSPFPSSCSSTPSGHRPYRYLRAREASPWGPVPVRRIRSKPPPRQRPAASTR